MPLPQLWQVTDEDGDPIVICDSEVTALAYVDALCQVRHWTARRWSRLYEDPAVAVAPYTGSDLGEWPVLTRADVSPYDIADL